MVARCRLFQNNRFGLFAAANFNAQFQLRPVRLPGFPLSVEAQTRTFVRILVEENLVSVPLVQTGRESLAALAIEQVRQDFDDSGRGRLYARDRTQRADQQEQQLKPAHESSVTAVGPELNGDLEVKCLSFSAENENMTLRPPKVKTVSQ